MGGSDAEVLFTALERLSELPEVRNAFVQDAALLPFLRQGAEARDPRVRRLVALLAARLCQEETGAALLADPSFLASCQELLLDSETGTGEAISKALCSAAKWDTKTSPILNAEDCLVQRLLVRLASLSDVNRIRVLHLFVDLGRVSLACFAE